MMSAALQTIKKFRLHEIKGLQKHILRFGPLQTQSSVDASAALRLPNPFVPRKNPNTGRWVEPKYSLRRQTELVKKAKTAGLLHLLPPGPKNPLSASPSTAEGEEAQSSALKEIWAMPVAWEGSREYKPVPGTELGIRLYAAKKRMFKGHKWERVKAKRETRKRILLRDMDKRIFNYKNYHKRRRPNPLKPPRTVKAPKLPF